MNKVRILQVNTNRSAGSQDLARALGEKLKCSFICLQEPNKKITSTRATNLYTSSDQNKDAAIYCGKNCKIPVFKTVSRSGFVFVQCLSFCLYSVYVSPNCAAQNFEAQINELFIHAATTATSTGLPLIICGDFNAKNRSWGGNVTDTRGVFLQRSASGQGLVALNRGSHPTLKRSTGESFIDLTFVSPGLAAAAWRVMAEDDVLSDHLPILVELEVQGGGGHCRDFVRAADPGLFLKNLRQVAMERWNGEDVDETIGKITRAYNRSKIPVKTDPSGTMPYWWDDEIAGLVRSTRSCRRKYQRNQIITNSEQLKNEFSESRRKLVNSIRKKKRSMWRSLCKSLDGNMFGDAYNIVRRQLKCLGPKLELSLTDKRKIFENMFVTRPMAQQYCTYDNQSCPAVTEAELEQAVSRIKTGRAPGPDSILPEHARSAIMSEKLLFLSIYSKCLTTCYFPTEWKTARLVLIEKPGGNPENGKKYRPICLLSVLGKVLESIIDARLKTEIERTGGLSENQFGFRAGKSTIDALEKVTSTIQNERRKIVTLIFLDVKNAFNTADWGLIIHKIKKRLVAPGMVQMVTSYLSGRRVLLDRRCAEEVCAGVPQGSVLGPTLWNVMYDDVMRACDGIGVELVCYADDLAVVVKADTAEETIDKGNRALAALEAWMEVNMLELAPEKTTSVVFAWSYKHRREIAFQLGNHKIVPQKCVKYLGVVLDFNMTFSRHVDSIMEKADRIRKTVNILLANKNGPDMSKRRVLAAALQSALTYGCSVWVEALKTKRNVERLISYQRSMAIRCCSGYNSISAEAATVLAGMIPLDLLIDEIYRVRKRKAEDETRGQRAIKDQERETTVIKWQERWSHSSSPAAWTRKLIGNIRNWLGRKHGEVDFYLTQALTGHGCFQFFLHRIGKADNPSCGCGEGVDDAEHTLFACKNFENERGCLERKTRRTFCKSNMINTMLESQEGWTAVSKFARAVMGRKEQSERDGEQRARAR